MNSNQQLGTLKYDVLPNNVCYLNQVLNQAKSSDKKGQQHRNRGLTRDTRATVMQALDRRTIQMLDKFKNLGIFTNMYGTISTGKEANVYRGTTTFEDLKFYGKELLIKNLLSEEDINAIDDVQRNTNLGYVNRAIKVFKTSVLTFKDRSKYVEGEFRFRRGYFKSKNPRKMVTQWCEKEFRNLKRIVISGLRCPIPIYIKKHIFVMSFIGDGYNLEMNTKDEINDNATNNINKTTGNAAPRLKDVPMNISKKKWIRLYIETIGIMYIMFNKCHLIHGDMSEYNTLLYKDHVYIIDVSQSMEHDHPLGLEFLKRDCINVSVFFDRVLRSRKDTNFPDEIQCRFKEDELNNETIELNFLNFILSPPELYKLITQVNCTELLDFFNTSLDDLKDESIDIVKKIILFILESKELEWPTMDNIERENIIRSSYINKQKNEILSNTYNNNKVFLAILFLITNYLLNGETKCNNLKPNIFSSQSDDYVFSNNKVENNIFLNTWSPLHLNQILDRKTLEKELDRKECGQKLLYGHLIYGEETENGFNKHENDTDSDISYPETNIEGSNEFLHATSSIEKLYIGHSEDEYIEVSDSGECNLSSLFETGKTDIESEGIKDEKKGFKGKIPENFTKKEWKRKVKQENREKRSKKIPKHIKKRGK